VTAAFAIATYRPGTAVASFVVIGLFLLASGVGGWGSKKLNERAGSDRDPIGVAKYWRGMLVLGAVLTVIGFVIAAG
jgi:hypothetical protein